MVTTMGEIKVCDADTLLHLCKQADKYEFNRRIDTEALAERINRDLISVMQVFIPYHRASFGPTIEPVWPDHHRVMVVTGLDNDETVELWLDVEASTWEQLMTSEELIKKMNDPIEMGIAYARAAANDDEYN